jgi:hypothetical protein
VYQSKSLTLLLLLVVLCAAAVSLSDGGPFRDIPRDVRSEAHDDSIAIREDAAMIRDTANSAPVEVKMMWASISYHVVALHAAAKAETKVAATHLSPHPKDW